MSRNIPPVEICEFIDSHIKEFGAYSHLWKLWTTKSNKRWLRNEMIEKCLYRLDFSGGKILNYCMDSQAKRSKVRRYIFQQYPTILGLTEDQAKLKDLQSRVKIYLRDPSTGNLNNLEKLL